jgi:hypothetical protein
LLGNRSQAQLKWAAVEENIVKKAAGKFVAHAPDFH